MGEFFDYFRHKKNLANLLILGILILALPLAVQTVREQQIIKSRAAADPIVITGDNLIDLPGGKKGFKLNSAGKAVLDLEINSPVESSVKTVQSDNAVMSLLPRGGLVENAFAVDCTEDCSVEATYCDEEAKKLINKHGGYCDTDSGSCVFAFDEVGECGGGNDDPPPDDGSWCTSGRVECNPGSNIGECDKDGKKCTKYQSGYVCNVNGKNYCEPNSFGCDEPCRVTGRIDSAADGAGGCCDSGAADNSARGCRRDNNPGGFRERCDIDNGACASGLSCRSETGCALDTDCGYNKHCENGQCKDGPANKNCKVAGSIQARFNAQQSLTVPSGTKVTAGVYRNGTGVAMAALVNGVKPVDTFSASVSGPGGFSLNVDPASSTDFIPKVGGKYTLTGTCGVNLKDAAVLTVTGGPSPSPSVRPSGSPPGEAKCPADSNLKVTPSAANVGDDMVFEYKAGQDTNLGGDTWNGGIDSSSCKWDIEGRKFTCKAKSAADNGYWNHRWDSGKQCASASYKITGTGPTPTSPPVTTKLFRVAEAPADFTETGRYGWQEYTSTPMKLSFEFKDTAAGLKNIFVEFKYSNDKTERRSIQIKLVGPDPAITNCSLTFEGKTTAILNLTGTNFGAAKGTIKSGEKVLEAREWKDSSIKAVFPNAPEGQKINVSITNPDSQSAESNCSAIAQLALGAKVFCRAPAQHNTDNVELTLAGLFEGGIKVKQKVTIDKEGVVQGLSQKLEAGKKYKVSIKAPKSLRRTTEITAEESGTTNIPNFVLPVGDIFPADGGDGTINSYDKAELNRQWIIAKDATGRSADFNKDNRVNTIDWACMRYDFGDSDHADPAPGAPSIGIGTTTPNRGIGSTAPSGIGSTPPQGTACIQVITPAKNPATGECKEFPTPCDLPVNWQRVDKCDTN